MQPTVATIGFFDGVHMGHEHLIRQVSEIAAIRHMEAAVVTFPVHPRQVLQPDFRPQLLTTSEEKLTLLQHYIPRNAEEKAELLRDNRPFLDRCIMMEFTPEVARLTAREFMLRLRDEYDVRILVTGYDHRFGHNRSEGFKEYAAYGEELGMEVIRAQAYLHNKQLISSSYIRQLITEGDMEKAGVFLGADYFLQGTVVGGHHVGCSLGYPTANLRINSPLKLVPADGVYAVQVQIDHEPGHHIGMMNIGHRPTLDNGSDRSIEVHILDFTGNLYGHHLLLRFASRIRSEQKFDTLDALTRQLAKDAATVREML